MTVSRREFLKRGAIIGATAALPLNLTVLAAAQSDGWKHAGDDDLFATTSGDPYEAVTRLSKASFTPNIGTIFKLYAKTKTVDIRLVAIRDVASPTGKPVPGGECFDLYFQGAPSLLLGQNTYIIDHAKLGKFALFVVQNGRDGKASYFEAVFNRRLV
jgi:hypothetical protein